MLNSSVPVPPTAIIVSVPSLLPQDAGVEFELITIAEGSFIIMDVEIVHPLASVIRTV